MTVACDYGSDGDVTISTTVTLTRDMYYNKLTFAESGQILTNGFRVYYNRLVWTGDSQQIAPGVFISQA